MAEQAIIETETLKNIATAIIEKGSTVREMTASRMADEIRNLPQTVVKVVQPDKVTGVLNFYDYDGRLLYVYTKQDIGNAEFTLPPLPARDGINYVCWSHSSEDVKKAGSVEAPCLDVMPICEVAPGSDGLAPTRLYLQLANPGAGTSYQCKARLVFSIKQGSQVVIDWGDGTSQNVVSYSPDNGSDNILDHTYFSDQASETALTKNVVITIFPSSDTTLQLGLGDGNMFPTSELNTYSPSVVEAQVVSVEVGPGVTLAPSCFANCSGLRSVLLPATVGPLPERVFSGCTSLQAVVIQKEHFGSGAGTYQFENCYGLKTLVLCPDVDAIPGYSFRCCTGIESLVIPGSVGSNLSSGAFSCGGAPSRPCLRNLGICEGVTMIPYAAFSGIIRSVVAIRLPSTVNEIDYDAFAGITSNTVGGVSLTKVIDLSLPSATHDVEVPIAANGHSLVGDIGGDNLAVSFPPGFKIVLSSDQHITNTGLWAHSNFVSAHVTILQV